MSWMMRSSGGELVTIYTDGSCLKDHGAHGGSGGWAAILLQGQDVAEISGSEPDTTNIRMEMVACIRALEYLPLRSMVYLFTDSQYVRQGIQHWIHAWKRREWKTTTGEPVRNQDLWVALDAQNARHVVTWQWVRGHNGDHYNERCDVLAVRAAKAGKLAAK